MNFKIKFDKKYQTNPQLFGEKPLTVIQKTVQYVKKGRVLLLGVGNGRNASFFIKKNFEVTGIDISEEGINILKNKFPNKQNLTLITQDVTKINFDKKFNIITAIGLLHFLKSSQIRNLIKKMQNLTLTKGINIIIVRMNQNHKKNLPYIFQKNELKNYYNKTNWNIKKYEEITKNSKKIAILIAQKIKN